MDFVSLRRRDYMYSYSKSEPPRLTTHYHDYYEIIYILQGDLSYVVEDSSYKVSAGDVFITEPGEVHTLSFSSNDVYERHFIQVSKGWISMQEYDFLHDLSKRRLGLNNHIPAEVVKKYGMEKIFEQVRYYAENKLPESDIMIKTYIVQLLVAISNIYKKEIQILAQPRTSETTAEIKKYIAAHFLENLSLDDIAAHFYISKYYLCHMFKHETGVTVKEFINTQRIARAKKLLPEYGNTNQLYSKCGFNDYSTFYKTFRRFTGVSPKEFLK